MLDAFLHEVANVTYLTGLATVHKDGNPSLAISCLADYRAGDVVLQAEEADDFAWVTLAEAKDYPLIDGIYDELAMAEKQRQGTKTEWQRAQDNQ